MKRKEVYSVEDLAKKKLSQVEKQPRPELWKAIQAGIAPKPLPFGFESLFKFLSSGYGLQLGIVLFLGFSIVSGYWLVNKYSTQPLNSQETTMEVPENLTLEEINPENAEQVSPSLVPETKNFVPDTQKLVRVLVLDSPKNGSLRFDLLSKSFTYTPREDFFGIDSFTFAKVYNNNVREKSSTVLVKVEPLIEVEANFAYENVGDLQLRLFNRTKVSSNDPSITEPDFIRWELGDGRSSLQASPSFRFQQEGMQTVCLTVGLDSIVREHCVEIMVTRDPNNNSDNINAKGKSNQPVTIPIEEKTKRPSREIVLPLEGMMKNFKTAMNGITFYNMDRLYVGVDTNEQEQAEFNQQPVKKKRA